MGLWVGLHIWLLSCILSFCGDLALGDTLRVALGETFSFFSELRNLGSHGGVLMEAAGPEGGTTTMELRLSRAPDDDEDEEAPGSEHPLNRRTMDKPRRSCASRN